MKDMMVNTLIPFACTINSLANELSKKKNSQAQVKKLQHIQAALADFAKKIEKTDQAVEAFGLTEPAASLKPLWDEILKSAHHQLAPIAALGRDKLVAVLTNPKSNQLIVQFKHILEGIDRNLELRKMAIKNLNESKETAENNILKEKRLAYAKQVEQDNALLTLLRTTSSITPLIISRKLNESNQQWAKILEEKFNIQNLRENNRPPQKPSPFANVISTFFEGLSDLFKDLTNSDGSENGFKIPVMNFLGKIIPSVLGMFAGLFKGFLGGTAAEQDKKVQDFNNNVTGFFMKQMNKEPKDFTPKQSAAATEEFTPMHNNFKASAPGLRNSILMLDNKPAFTPPSFGRRLNRK